MPKSTLAWNKNQIIDSDSVIYHKRIDVILLSMYERFIILTQEVSKDFSVVLTLGWFCVDGCWKLDLHFGFAVKMQLT